MVVGGGIGGEIWLLCKLAGTLGKEDDSSTKTQRTEIGPRRGQKNRPLLKKEPSRGGGAGDPGGLKRGKRPDQRMTFSREKGGGFPDSCLEKKNCRPLKLPKTITRGSLHAHPPREEAVRWKITNSVRARLSSH